MRDKPTYSALDTTLPGDPLIGRILESKYRLICRIGAGAMGTVYQAERVHIGDEIAVKVMDTKLLGDKSALERFRREAKAAAMLHHPNIVMVHDFSEGQGDSPAFIAMEFLDGESLRSLLSRESKLKADRAVSLMFEICSGVGAAHRAGVIHRDLKPDNVMVISARHGKPETVKVLDFGIAKVLEITGSVLTEPGMLIGTPYYMSPEQCRGESLDARSDVYSLGAVFYEMLVGSPPFTASNRLAVITKHLTETPPPIPKHLAVAPEIESVVRRALSKNLKNRSANADEFARELKAAISPQRLPPARIQSTKEPSVDRPPTILGQAARNPLGAKFKPPAANIAKRGIIARRPILILCIAVLAVSILAYVLVMMSRQGKLNKSPNPDEISSTAPSTVAASPPTPKYGLLGTCSAGIDSVAFSPDGKTIAVGCSDSIVLMIDVATGQMNNLGGSGKCCLGNSVAFSPDSQSLAAGKGDDATVRIWSVRTRQSRTLGPYGDALRPLPNGGSVFNGISSIAFSPDGSLIASGGGDKTIRTWDVQTGQQKVIGRTSEPIYAVAFSPDGSTIASAGYDTGLKLWNIANGTLHSIGTNKDIHALTFSPDGRFLASGGEDKTLRIFNLQTGGMRVLGTCKEKIYTVSFSPNGRYILTGSLDWTARIWNVDTGKSQTLAELRGGVHATFSPDGKSVVTGSTADGEIRVWRIDFSL